MKTIIALALALTASTAMASLNKSSSWSEIFAADATLVFEENLGGIALSNACLTATEIKTINATKNCAKLVPVEVTEGDYTYTDWVCEKWVVSHVSYPRTTTVSKCAEYGHYEGNMVCVRYENKNVTVAGTIKVSVVEDPYAEVSNGIGFTKAFSFPACK